MDLKFNRASYMIGIKSIFVTEPNNPNFNRHNNVIGNNPKFIAETKESKYNLHNYIAEIKS